MDETASQMACNITAANSSCINMLNQPNESFSMDYTQVVEFPFYAWGIAGNIVSALGVVGNILSLFVLANRRMQSSTSVYLIALSFFDSIVLISLTLFMALPAIYYATGALEAYHNAYPYLQPFAYPLALTAQTCSIYITVGFTIERFIAVCYPLHAAKWCTVERARKAIGIVLLASVIYNIPRWLEYHTVLQFDEQTNRTYAIFTYTNLGENSTFRHIYFIFMHMFVMLLIPFVVLSVLNTMLIRAVKHSARAEGKVTNKQQRENNLTAMLIAVVVVFLICQVPSIVDNIFAATLEETTLRTLPFVKVTCISSLMVILNSAVNFYLYCVFGQKFRSVFCRIFCSFWSKNKDWNHGTSLASHKNKDPSLHKRKKSTNSQGNPAPSNNSSLLQNFLLQKKLSNGNPHLQSHNKDASVGEGNSLLHRGETAFETEI